MARFLLSRLIQFPLILAIIYLTTFTLVWLAPGDPFAMLNERNNPEAAEQLRRQFNADSPWTFLATYPVKLLSGEMGPSFKYQGVQVGDIIRDTLPVSVAIGSLAVAIATCVGIFIGTLSALPPTPPRFWLPAALSGYLLYFVWTHSITAPLGMPQGWWVWAGVLALLLVLCAALVVLAVTGTGAPEYFFLLISLIGADLIVLLIAGVPTPKIASGLLASVLMLELGRLVAAALMLLAAVWIGKSPVSSLGAALALVGVSVPSFVVAAALLTAFAYNLELLPLGGWPGVEGRGFSNIEAYELNKLPWLEWGIQLPIPNWLAALADYAAHMILPAIALSLLPMAYITRLTRVSMLDVLGSEFVRTARAKGLSKFKVVFKHCLRNAILPVLSFLGPATANVLVGSFVVETIFVIPGLGPHFVASVQSRDQPLILGTVMIYSLFLLTLNLLVDVAYTFVDPRIELAGKGVAA